jgi:hypothetical protein
MADIIDQTDEREAIIELARVQQAAAKAAAIPAGVPGECEKCGEDMPRLVGGVCCPCRDKYKLP